MLRSLKTGRQMGLLLAVILFGVVSMSNAEEKSSVKQAPTLADAESFMNNAEAKMLELSVYAARADWVKATYITDDTEILAAQADERAIAAQVEFAKQATRFDGLKLPTLTTRQSSDEVITIAIATVTWNEPIPADYFTPPKDIR